MMIILMIELRRRCLRSGWERESQCTSSTWARAEMAMKARKRAAKVQCAVEWSRLLKMLRGEKRMVRRRGARGSQLGFDAARRCPL